MAGEHQRIVLKGDDKNYFFSENEVAGTITYPGMQVTMAADGDYDPCSVTQAEALKSDECLLAVEDALQGRGVDTPYAVGDPLFLYNAQPGDHVLVLVKSGQNILVGDNLVVEGGGSGLFVEAAGTETKYQYKALESSGGALAANTLIKCRRV